MTIDWSELVLPVMAAPMIIVSNPALVTACCRAGIIDPLTVIPPSDMVASMIDRISSGELDESIARKEAKRAGRTPRRTATPR